MNNPFKSDTSTNLLRGFPISGRLLTVDIEEYWFDPDRRHKDANAMPMTLRVFENAELTQVLNIEADALVALFIDGDEFFQKKWANGTKEEWVCQKSGGLVRVSGGYGGGAVLAAEDEFRYIAKKAEQLIDGMTKPECE